MEQGLVILMNKTPYVGRFYRLFCVPVVGDADLWADIQPIYSCDNKNAHIEADCIRFDALGTYTITVSNGTYSGSIIVEAREEPTISRTKRTVKVRSFKQLKSVCEQTYLELHIKPAAIIEIKDEPIYVGEGTILDFDNKVFNYVVRPDVTVCSLFKFCYDNSGIQNVWFNNLTDPAQERNEQSLILHICNGDNVKVKNIVSQNQWGYGFRIGTPALSPYWQDATIDHHYTRWQETSLTETPAVGGVEQGGINADGTLNDDSLCWRTADYILCPYCTDDAYFVATHRTNTWPTAPARYVNVAFYDADHNFLELQTQVQYWRKYPKPVGAVYWKAFVVQPEAPTNRDTDSNCIMRMFGNHSGQYGNVYRATDRGPQPAMATNPCVDGYICLTNDSGFCSIADSFNDLNINNVYVEKSGRDNLWGWDFEDGWYSMVGVVNSKVWADAVVACSSTQGMTFRECRTGVYYAASDPMQRTYIGCIFRNFFIRGCVGYHRLINCYRENTTWEEPYTAVFESSVMSDEHRRAIYDSVTKWKTSRLPIIKKRLKNAGSPITG